MILFDSLFTILHIMVDFKYIIRTFLWLAFSFYWVDRGPLWVFFPFAPKFPFSCASVCTHCRGISRGPQSPSSCFRLESHIQRQLYFTDWQFSIIKLHEYEDSCRIPTMPHGEDLHQNSFSVHCDLLECLSGASVIWRLLHEVQAMYSFISEPSQKPSEWYACPEGLTKTLRRSGSA